MAGNEKSPTQLLNDLSDHTVLLLEACDRFRENHKLNEIKNIAHRLRVLLGSGRGNHLFWAFAENKKAIVFVTTNYIEMKITEVDNQSGRVLQSTTKRKLLLNPVHGQPTLPVITLREDYKDWLSKTTFHKWFNNGFLMDWEVPNKTGATPSITRLTPEKLLTRFANSEASHSDRDFHEDIGIPFEAIQENCIFNRKEMKIPVTYNYLYQIGQVTAKLSAEFLGKQGFEETH